MVPLYTVSFPDVLFGSIAGVHSYMSVGIRASDALMFLDVSFAMTSRGFEAVMTCVEEAMPHVARRDFEDAWATVMHVFACASQWVAAGDGQPWAQAVLCRLSSLLHFGIWGAIALDLEPHPTRPGHCLVPARYKKVSHGWQVYGGDQHLCGQALQARKLLAVLVWRLSKRPDARQAMLWCLLTMDILTKMRAHVAAQLRAMQGQGDADRGAKG